MHKRSIHRWRALLMMGFLFSASALWSACSTPNTERVLTFSEQLEVDTKKAEALFSDYQKKVHFVAFPQGTAFLNGVAQKVAKIRAGFAFSNVKVLIHNDDQKNLSKFFSFPGTTISMPLSFLKKVEFENELAAAFAYELAGVMNRHLAVAMEEEIAEKTEEASVPVESSEFQLFGEDSVFNLDRPARSDSIRLGSKLLYYAGYDLRGMPSIFNQYGSYFAVEPLEQSGSRKIDGVDLMKKEVEFNLRESQRAKSELLPTLNPVVRSADFITMKKAALRL